MKRSVPPFPIPREKKKMIIRNINEQTGINTTDATLTLAFDLPLDAGESVEFVIESFARESATGDSYGTVLAYTIKTSAPNNDVLGFTVVHEAKDPGSAAWNIVVTGTSTGFTVEVQGEAMKDIDWVLTIKGTGSKIGTLTPGTPEAPVPDPPSPD